MALILLWEEVGPHAEWAFVSGVEQRERKG
jgi:hypothetical protein